MFPFLYAIVGGQTPGLPVDKIAHSFDVEDQSSSVLA